MKKRDINARRSSRRTAGFTIVEVIIALAVFGIMATGLYTAQASLFQTVRLYFEEWQASQIMRNDVLLRKNTVTLKGAAAFDTELPAKKNWMDAQSGYNITFERTMAPEKSQLSEFFPKTIIAKEEAQVTSRLGVRTFQWTSFIAPPNEEEENKGEKKKPEEQAAQEKQKAEAKTAAAPQAAQIPGLQGVVPPVSQQLAQNPTQRRAWYRHG